MHEKPKMSLKFAFSQDVHYITELMVKCESRTLNREIEMKEM